MAYIDILEYNIDCGILQLKPELNEKRYVYAKAHNGNDSGFFREYAENEA